MGNMAKVQLVNQKERMMGKTKQMERRRSEVLRMTPEHHTDRALPTDEPNSGLE